MFFIQIQGKIFFDLQTISRLIRYCLRLKKNISDRRTIMTDVLHTIPPNQNNNYQSPLKLGALCIRIETDFGANGNFIAFKQIFPTFFPPHAVLHNIAPALYGGYIRPHIHRKQFFPLHLKLNKQSLQNRLTSVLAYLQGQDIFSLRLLQALLQIK